MVAVIFTILAFAFSAFAAQPSYEMKIDNPALINEKTVEFDITIQSKDQNFLLTSYQCVLEVNSNLSADTSIKFEYINSTSDLSNPPSYGIGFGMMDGAPKIHFASFPGNDTITNKIIKIGRFRVTDDNPFQIDSLKIQWDFESLNKTILTGDNFEEITNPSDHSNINIQLSTTSTNNFMAMNIDDRVNTNGGLFKVKEGSKSSEVVYFTNTNSDAQFTINLEKSGEWFVWGRMFFELIGSPRNSFSIQVDNGPKMTFGNNNNSYDRWHWEGNSLLPLSLGNLNAGTHTITIFGRECGETVMLDEVLLTQDPEFQPSDNAVTPVELISFKAFLNNNNEVELNWLTATETNNSGFNIEKRNENSDWERIGFVTGNGTSTSSHNYKFVDGNISKGKTFYYRLKQVDNDGSYEYSNVIEVNVVLNKFELSQNFPNPFNPSTKIRYTLKEKSNIKLNIYNLLGENIAVLKNEVQSEGNYEVEWNAERLASGTYILALNAESLNGGKSFSSTKKMTLLK